MDRGRAVVFLLSLYWYESVHREADSGLVGTYHIFLPKLKFSEFLMWTECRLKLLIQSLYPYRVIGQQFLRNFERWYSRMFIFVSSLWKIIISWLSTIVLQSLPLSCLWCGYSNLRTFCLTCLFRTLKSPFRLLHLLVDSVSFPD